MSSESQPEWRQSLINRLRERNRHESLNFKDIISQNNRLIDVVSQLKAENLKISVENEQLRVACTTSGKDSGATNLAIAALEKKLLTQQEELTELHKRKGENSQLIVDLNVKVEKQKKIISEKEHRLVEQISINQSLKAEVQMLKSNLEELKKLNMTLLDEHTALQLAFSSLEEKLRGVQDENRCLLDRLMRYKSKDADKLNEENESFLKKRSEKLKRDLEDAVRETPHRNSSTSPTDFPSESGGGGGDTKGGCGRGPDNGSSTTLRDNLCDDTMSSSCMCPSASSIGGTEIFNCKTLCPTTIFMKFEAHDTETNAVRWNPVDRMLATGGADRKVKLWDIGKRSPEPRAILGGSSAGINSVDFDSTGTYILGTSNDYGARVWTVADNRLRHTLTGHSGKVMAAKYLQEPTKVVTGSHDRTLKVWDLRSIACIETKFAGSSCNDLVTTDSLGSTIISGHYDKKIRFWDIRTEKQADDVLMPAKITSLDMSKDCNYLICSVRDDTIQLLDLRKNQVVGSFCDENFKLSCDWARASLSSNGSQVACGSSDGSIFIWNILGCLETTLKGHQPGSGYSFLHSCAVNAVCWSPDNCALASVGKGRRCIVWVDA